MPNKKNKRHTYSPCDEQGKVVAKVADAHDFTDLCIFMSDQSDEAKALRKKAYEILGKNGEATPKAKIDFVRAVALDYFKKQLKTANSMSAQALSGDASEWEEREAEAFVGAMGSEFRSLISAVGADVFDGMLLATSMTPAARAALAKALWSGEEFAQRVVQIALEAEAGMACSAIEAWRSTPQARAAMNSPVNLEKMADRLVLNPKYGVYAPLLKFLTDHMGVAERAEYFARFEDYARSGFLDQDLALAKGAKRNGLSATPAAKAWSRMAGLVMSGQDPQPTVQDMKAALHARLAEVGLSVTVSRDEHRGFHACVAQFSPHDMETLAKTGQVDGVTLTVGGEALVSFVSTDSILKSQNAQWSRHFLGVEGALPDIDASRALYRVMVPCLMCDHPARHGSSTVGAPLAQWFGGSQRVGRELKGLINAAPFMNELMNGSRDVLAISKQGVGQWAAKIDLDLIGSSVNAWPDIKARIAASDDPDTEFCRHMLSSAGTLLEGLAQGARFRGADAPKLRGVATLDKSGPQIELLFKFAKNAATLCRTSPGLAQLAPVAKSVAAKARAALVAVEPESSAQSDLTTLCDILEALTREAAKKARAAKKAVDADKPQSRTGKGRAKRGM